MWIVVQIDVSGGGKSTRNSCATILLTSSLYYCWFFSSYCLGKDPQYNVEELKCLWELMYCSWAKTECSQHITIKTFMVGLCVDTSFRLRHFPSTSLLIFFSKELLNSFFMNFNELFQYIALNILFLIALLRYNWYMKTCTYLMCTIWCVWTYANTCDTITTIKVIDKSNTDQSFLVSFYFWWGFFVARTFNMRATLLPNFEVHNTILLAVGTTWYIWSLELIHLA